MPQIFDSLQKAPFPKTKSQKPYFYHTRIMKSFILMLLTECLSILFAHAQVMDSIPFELGKDNRVYIHCRVNDSDTLRFLFDTGATDMVLNPNSPRSNFSISWNEQIINQGARGCLKMRRPFLCLQKKSGKS